MHKDPKEIINNFVFFEPSLCFCGKKYLEFTTFVRNRHQGRVFVDSVYPLYNPVMVLNPD
jgi:hypothetical protein